MTWHGAPCQEKRNRGSHPSRGRAVTNSRKTYRNLVLNTTINRRAGYLQPHLARLPRLVRFSYPSLCGNRHKQVVNSLKGRCVYYRSSSPAHYVGFSPGGGFTPSDLTVKDHRSVWQVVFLATHTHTQNTVRTSPDYFIFHNIPTNGAKYTLHVILPPHLQRPVQESFCNTDAAVLHCRKKDDSLLT